MSSDQTATIVVAAVVEQRGRVLIQQKKTSSSPENIGRWECPGGKVKFGESFERALKREVKEELGMVIVVGRLMHSQINTYSSGIDYNVLYYHCTLPFSPQGVMALRLMSYRTQFVLPDELKQFDTLPGTIEAVSHLGEVTAEAGTFSFVENDVRNQPIDDTLRILTYEVGRMNELVHKGKVYGTKLRTARNKPLFLLKNQTADALSMLRMFCEHQGWDFDAMKKLGEMRYMDRMGDIGKHGKTLR